MKSICFAIVLQLVLATSVVAAQTQITKGTTVLAANGLRLGTVYRVDADGSVQVIIDYKMVTIPASTLSRVGGKLRTDLTKKELLDARSVQTDLARQARDAS